MDVKVTKPRALLQDLCASDKGVFSLDIAPQMWHMTGCDRL